MSLTPPPAPEPQPYLPAWQPAAPPRRGGGVGLVVAFAIALLVGLLVLGYLAVALGLSVVATGTLLALVPLAVVLLAVRWVDRWEPEPAGLVVFAVAWGAIAAVAIALGVDLALSVVFGPASTPAADALSAIVQAPIVEEFGKGLGVYIIFVTARRAFDGPVDGIVYGALIGAGFAFTENIQYFAVSFLEGGAADTTVTFFMRGILSLAWRQGVR